MRLDVWQDIIHIQLTWESQASDRTALVGFSPPLSRCQAWAKQLSSCKAMQVATLTSTGEIRKPKQDTPPSCAEDMLAWMGQASA